MTDPKSDVPDDRHCGAKKRQGPGTCTRPAGWGTDHVGAGTCKLHGGTSPSGAVAGRRVLAERVMKDAVIAYGLPTEVDPGTALLDEVKRTAGHVQWLQGKVKDLDPDELVWGQRTISRQQGVGADGPVDVTTAAQAAGINVWLELYLKERDHLRKVCADALKAGIAERQVQLAEQAGERVGLWFRTTLDVLDLSSDDMGKVMAAATANLYMLDGAGGGR